MTTQPTQALTMLNSDFMNEQAALLALTASRSELDGRRAPRAAWVGRALEMALPRPASGPDRDRGGGDASSSELEARGGTLPAELAAGKLLRWSFLNLNEFVYLD